jgi:hypothetical protein
MYPIQAQKRPVTKLLRSSCNPPQWLHHRAFAASFDVSHRRTHVHQRRGSLTLRFRRFLAVQSGKQG